MTVWQFLSACRVCSWIVVPANSPVDTSMPTRPDTKTNAPAFTAWLKSGEAWASGVATVSRISGECRVEARVVAERRQVLVRPRLLAEAREPSDRAPQTVEPLVAGLARERREAGVVVVQARMVGRELEPFAHGRKGVGVPSLAVRVHRLHVERPGVAP